MLLCLVFFLPAGAQDISFSQFYANRSYLNPAFTGLEEGLAFGAFSRLQWYQADRGYKVYGASAEWQEPCLRAGFGFNIHHLEEGLFNYKSTNLGLQFSYVIPGNRHNVHFGFSPRWVFRSVDYDRIIFSDELDPVFGAIFPTGFIPVTPRINFPDADFGVVWRFDGRRKVRSNALRNPRYSLGVSINHLFGLFSESPSFNQSLVGLETPLATRITLHGGSILETTLLQGKGNEFSISPNFKIDLQANMRTIALGTYFLLKGAYLGGFYQSRNVLPTSVADTESLVILLGYYLQPQTYTSKDGHSLLIGLSMDVNLSGLGAQAGNVYELVLRYRFAGMEPLFCRKGNLVKRKILDCQNFY